MMSFLTRYRQEFRQNLTLAYPIILGQVGQIIVNTADNVMVGRLGAAQLAAVSLANALFIALMVIGMGISFALPPLVAEANGNDNHHKISSYFKHSLIVNIVFALLAWMVIEMIIPTMKFWGQDPDVVEFAIPYLRISAVSLLPFMIFQTFRTYADGKSETLPSMFAMLFANVVNIVLNYMFIYGNWGAPALGVAGAAWGSLIARIIMLLLVVLILYFWKDLWRDIYKANYKLYKWLTFNTILKLGVPTSLQGFFEVSAFGGAAILIGKLSKEAQAAHQIAINLASISFMVCVGIGMAATIRIGNFKGQQNMQKVRDVGFSAILQVVAFMMMTSILYISLRYFFPSLYISNQEVIDIAAQLLILASIFQLPDGIQVTAIGALRGLQDVNVPTLITFIAYYGFALPIGYLFAFQLNWGAKGVWLGLTAGLTCSALLMTYRFHKLSKTS